MHDARDAHDPAFPDDAPRPMEPDEERAVKATSAPAGALAGAAAGGAAALSTVALGPLGAIAGVVLGAVVGGAVSAAGAATAGDHWTDAEDAHYRALYEDTPGRVADRGYDAVRPAYRFGHLAASERSLSGRAFDDVEPELRSAWSSELATRVGPWEGVRPYVRDAYGHARSMGAGVFRNLDVLGSGGSAVDPVELDRARHGLDSRAMSHLGGVVIDGAVLDVDAFATAPADIDAVTEHVDAPRHATPRTGGTPGVAGAPGGPGERPEVDANTAHRRDAELH